MATNNTVTLIGNLGKTPEILKNDKGSYLILSLATTDSYKDKKLGAYIQKKPVWHSIFVSGSKIQDHALNFKKGDRIKVTATLSYRKREYPRMFDKNPKIVAFNEAILTAKRIEASPLKRKEQSKVEG